MEEREGLPLEGDMKIHQEGAESCLPHTFYILLFSIFISLRPDSLSLSECNYSEIDDQFLSIITLDSVWVKINADYILL